jgi:TPR repeat protein
MRKKFPGPILTCLAILSASAARADYQAGFDAFSTGEYETALTEWSPLAEQGDANSQFGLGLLYANGWGVAQDDATALQWYERAAGQGHGEARYNIGVMYQNGWGVEQSDADALKWMLAAAETGFAAAHRALGDMYEGGIGVDADNVQAYRWFESGATLGDSQAGFDRDELAMNMDSAAVADAIALAKRWLSEFRAMHPDHPVAED